MAYGSQGQIMDASQAASVRNTNSIMAGWIDRGPGSTGTASQSSRARRWRRRIPRFRFPSVHKIR